MRRATALAALVAAGAAVSCESDLDCSLNGVCTAGACVCDAPWKDSAKEGCSVLDVLPHPDDYVPAYGGPRTDTAWHPQNLTSWGGNVVRGDDGRWHLFASAMDGGGGLKTWVGNSRIDHAVADDPMDAFKFVSTALPKESHNASPLKTTNGSYVIFHIGSGAGGSSFAHFSNSVDGPWEPLGNSLSHCNNPAPALLRNGSVLVICSNGGFGLHHTSDLFTGGGWTKTLQIPLPSAWTEPRQYVRSEDPFLWEDKRGYLHFLQHNYDYRDGYPKNPNETLPILVSAHGFSRDGLEWHFNTDQQPYDAVVTFRNGTKQQFSTFERPHLVFDASGTPTHLLNGVQAYYEGPRGPCDGCDARSGSEHSCVVCKTTAGLDYTYTLATKLNVPGASQ